VISCESIFCWAGVRDAFPPATMRSGFGLRLENLLRDQGAAAQIRAHMHPPENGRFEHHGKM